MTAPLRLAMLGAWHTHAHGLVRQIAAHPEEFLLRGLYDPDTSVLDNRLATWRGLIPDLRRLESPTALLAEPIDAVLVEGLVDQNLHWARLALEAGYHVLLEKPAGVDLAEFRSLCRLARERNLHLQMAYLFRYMPAVQRLLELARQDFFGRIYHFRARLPKDLSLYESYVQELGRYPGGIFFEMAGHVIDLMVGLLGEPPRVTPFLAHQHDTPGTFVDHGLAVFEFPHAWGTIEVNALETATGARRIEVFGTRGAAIIPNLGSGHLRNDEFQIVEEFQAGHEGWQRHEFRAQPLQIRDLRELRDVISRVKSPDFNPRHDLAVQRALLRACAVTENP